MKRIIVILLAAALLLSCSACSKADDTPINLEPKVTQMKAICELAVYDVYYHDVAKVFEEDASGAWFWAKDKHFWVEFSGIVRLGIDVSRVKVSITENQVDITMPEAKVLDCRIDSNTLNEDSFIIAEGSAETSADDTVIALKEAQEKMKATAAADKTLLASAQQRAQVLLEEYINNISEVTGKAYSVHWIYVDENGNQAESAPENVSPTAAETPNT